MFVGLSTKTNFRSRQIAAFRYMVNTASPGQMKRNYLLISLGALHLVALLYSELR
jgi:hypothetical protein